MFLLSRPPVFRWVAAVCLVVVAIWADLRPSDLDTHPFLRVAVAEGQVVDATMVEMLPVVPGTFETIELPATVGRSLEIGEPLTVSGLVEVRQPVPDGWLIVELAIPTGANPGAEVVVVVAENEGNPRRISGIVVVTGVDDEFGGETAACAFPPEDAALVAVAISEQRASVLVGT